MPEIPTFDQLICAPKGLRLVNPENGVSFTARVKHTVGVLGLKVSKPSVKMPNNTFSTYRIVSRDFVERWLAELQIYDEQAEIARAMNDWRSNKAYIDGQGNYHLKTEDSRSGPIAPWNQTIKNKFNNCSEFHLAARDRA